MIEKWVSELKVGDKVYVSNPHRHGSGDIKFVEKITKTQVTVNDSRFMKKSRRIIGSYLNIWISEWTQEREDKIRKEEEHCKRREELMSRLNSVSWYSYTNEQLQGIVKVLDTYKKEV